MRRGFTMIELLAVFTLTGIILLLAFPQMTSLLKKSNEEEYQTFLNSIYIASEAYMVDQNIIMNQGEICVTIKTLIESGFLKSTLVNPKNKKQVSNEENENNQVCITKNENNVFQFTFMDEASVIKVPIISLVNTPSNHQNGYLKGQVAKIVYSSNDITNPSYYVKTTRNAVSNLAVTETCGNGTVPGTCSGINSTKNLSANTWYKVSGDVNVIYFTDDNSMATIYAITYNGIRFSQIASATISKIDATSPTVTLETATTTTDSITIPFTMSDSESGLGTPTCKYSTTSGSYTTNASSISTTNCTISGAKPGTTYYYQVCVADKVGNTQTCKTGNAQTKKIYYIAYAANGGSGTMAKTTCTYGATCTLRANAFSKSGYTFNGWTGSNGGSYSNGQSVSNLTTTNGATITMTAKWVDTTKPTLTMTKTPVSNNMGYAGNYEVFHSTNYVNYTFTYSDNVGITGYYWGTTKPTSASSVSWTSTSAGSMTISRGYFGAGANMTVTSKYPTGTYYFAVRDAAGNISVVTSQCTAGRFIMYSSAQTISNPFGSNTSNLLINHCSSGNTLYISGVGSTGMVFNATKVFTGTTATSYSVYAATNASNVYAYYIFY